VDLVEQLVEKAEGPLYLCTHCCPNLSKVTVDPTTNSEKLFVASPGLDGLYREVLHNALTKFEYPRQRSMPFHHWNHHSSSATTTRDALSGLLDLPGDHVRGRLRDVQSVLIVPGKLLGKYSYFACFIP